MSLEGRASRFHCGPGTAANGASSTLPGILRKSLDRTHSGHLPWQREPLFVPPLALVTPLAHSSTQLLSLSDGLCGRSGASSATFTIRRRPRNAATICALSPCAADRGGQKRRFGCVDRCRGPKPSLARALVRDPKSVRTWPQQQMPAFPLTVSRPSSHRAGRLDHGRVRLQSPTRITGRE